MTTVANPTSTTSTTGASSAASAASSKTGTTTSATDQEDRFLKLLVTQMNNQDPLNPLDNAAVTSQMAQINTVSGIEKLNTTMQTMLSQFSSQQSLQGASLVGRSVLVEGNQMRLTQGVGGGGFALDGKADSARVDIVDSAGNTLDSLSLGALDAGTHTFAWDGKTADGRAMPDGSYSFKVTATLAGKPVDATLLAASRVSSVANTSDGLQLDLQDLGTHAYADVKSIF